MRFVRKVRNYLDVIVTVLLIVVAVASFVGGYIFATNIIKELPDEQYEICRELICQIYEKEEVTTIDIPDDMYFNKDSMEVGFERYYGNANATFENGKLIVERTYYTGAVIFLRIVFGAVTVVIGVLLYGIVLELVEKFQNYRQRE